MRFAAVKNEKAAAHEFHDAIANPNHSRISPKKLAQETSSKQPPEKETGKNRFIKMELKARQQADKIYMNKIIPEHLLYFILEIQ